MADASTGCVGAGQIRGVAILGAVFAEFMGLLSFVLGIMIMLKL